MAARQLPDAQPGVASLWVGMKLITCARHRATVASTAKQTCGGVPSTTVRRLRQAPGGAPRIDFAGMRSWVRRRERRTAAGAGRLRGAAAWLAGPMCRDRTPIRRRLRGRRMLLGGGAEVSSVPIRRVTDSYETRQEKKIP